MRYIKVLLLVLIFFVSMIFLFQNQETLGKDMTLRLHLFFLSPLQPLSLPTYFILLAGFLLGALVATALLLWEKISLSAKLMKAQWHIRNLEKEVAKYAAAASASPEEARVRFPFRKGEKSKNDLAAPDPDKDA